MLDNVVPAVFELASRTIFLGVLVARCQLNARWHDSIPYREFAFAIILQLRYHYDSIAKIIPFATNHRCANESRVLLLALGCKDSAFSRSSILNNLSSLPIGRSIASSSMIGR